MSNDPESSRLFLTKATGALTTTLSTTSWRHKGIGILRIGFGLIWLIDAWFKWQPAFQNNFASYLSADRQPVAVQAWINFWIHVVNINPSIFAHLVALGETVIALLLILGAFNNLTALMGIILCLMIWSTAEGFGGVTMPGATDVGASIIYVPVFIALFFTSAGLSFGLDQRLTPLLGKWGILASGSFKLLRKRPSTAQRPAVAPDPNAYQQQPVLPHQQMQARGGAAQFPVEQNLPRPVPAPNAATPAIAKGLLLVRTGPSAGSRFAITAPRVIIGRRSRQPFDEPKISMFELDDARVSRHHLELLVRPDGIYAHDIGSANGTWLNGRQLGGELVRLENGAELQVGPESTLSFQLL